MTAAHQTFDRTGWRAELIESKAGIVKSILANAMTALSNASEWAGVLAFDEFGLQTFARGAPPWVFGSNDWQPRPWQPLDDIRATEWLQRQDILVSVDIAQQAIEAVAQDTPFHPVAEYLDDLQWDGVPRIDTLMSTYFGAEETAYAAAVGRTSLIAAVARIREPGCKVDSSVILEGSQGAGKSSAVRALFDPWFTDELSDFGSKDAAMQMRGVWGVEVAELDAMNRSEVMRTKAFMTRTTDRFRPPYGHRIIESPRQCVFWGTTNSDEYLRDETGGRRFLPIKTGKIRLTELRADRDQLWAEAQDAYQAGASWWIVNPNVIKEALQEQRDRYVGDPWTRSVLDLMENMPDRQATVAQLLSGLEIPLERRSQVDANRVARILVSNGFRRTQVRIRGTVGRQWVYRNESGDTGDRRQSDDLSPAF